MLNIGGVAQWLDIWALLEMTSPSLNPFDDENEVHVVLSNDKQTGTFLVVYSECVYVRVLRFLC